MKVTIAQREKIKTSIMLTGVSGAGKTYGGLLLAKGMVDAEFPDMSEDQKWQKIGVIDTEHNRSKLAIGVEYAEGQTIGNFKHLDLSPPYTPDRYIKAIELMRKEDVVVIMIDSFTHAWAKEGGLLDIHHQVTENSRSKNSYTAWREVNPLEAKLHSAIFENYDTHMICTTRAKQEYSMERNEVEKMEITKLGLRPVQRDDVEYEFTLSLLIDHNHVADVMKGTRGLLERGNKFVLSTKVGHDIYLWAEKGVDVRAQEREKQNNLIAEIERMVEAYGEPIGKLVQELLDKVKKTSLNELTLKLVERVNELVIQKAKELEEELAKVKEPEEKKVKTKKADKEAKEEK